MLVNTEHSQQPEVAPSPDHTQGASLSMATDPELEARIRAAKTLVHMLRLRAQAQPEQVLLTFIDEDNEQGHTVTARELDASARRVAALLQRVGTAQAAGEIGAAGQRVLLALQPGQAYCAAFWGCLYARALAVPVYPPVSPSLAQRVETIARDSGATLVLTDSLVHSVGTGLHSYAPQLRDLQWIELEQLPAGSEALWNEVELEPEDLAYLQYTSGTTADPKGVMVTHANLLANLKSVGHVGEEDLKVGLGHGRSRGFSWLPPFHDMGLTGLLLPVATGSHLATCSPMLFIRRPERWVREISQRAANVSGGPNFAYELVAERAEQAELGSPESPESPENLDLNPWKVAVIGAEPVRGATIDRFCKVFERWGFRRESFCPSYGMAEATLYIASANDYSAPLICHIDKAALARGRVLVRDEPNETTLEFVGCGSAGPGMSVVIVNPNTCTLAAPGELGEIWACGPNITQGYWNNPELTRERFHAMLANPPVEVSPGPYFRTGDIGFWHREQLFIAGRLSEILHVRGRDFYPADLELSAQNACGELTPRGGAAFTVDDDDESQRIVLVHEVQERSTVADSIAPAIEQALLREHAVELSELVLIRRNSLLRTSSGKPRRHAVREAFLSQQLKILSAWKMSRA